MPLTATRGIQVEYAGAVERILDFDDLLEEKNQNLISSKLRGTML